MERDAQRATWWKEYETKTGVYGSQTHAACGTEAAGEGEIMRFTIYKEKFQPHVWKFAIRGTHGQLIATSKQSWESEDDVVEAIRQIKRGRIINHG